jgi:hypothetical protein
MKLTKEQIQSLGIPDEQKTDLLSLFDSVTAKEGEIESLRKKVPTDSQKVVESVDFDKYTAAVGELETLKQELAKKLPGKESDAWDFLNPFSDL